MLSSGVLVKLRHKIVTCIITIINLHFDVLDSQYSGLYFLQHLYPHVEEIETCLAQRLGINGMLVFSVHGRHQSNSTSGITSNSLLKYIYSFQCLVTLIILCDIFHSGDLSFNWYHYSLPDFVDFALVGRLYAYRLSKGYKAKTTNSSKGSWRRTTKAKTKKTFD